MLVLGILLLFGERKQFIQPNKRDCRADGEREMTVEHTMGESSWIVLLHEKQSTKGSNQADEPVAAFGAFIFESNYAFKWEGKGTVLSSYGVNFVLVLVFAVTLETWPTQPLASERSRPNPREHWIR